MDIEQKVVKEEIDIHDDFVWNMDVKQEFGDELPRATFENININKEEINDELNKFQVVEESMIAAKTERDVSDKVNVHKIRNQFKCLKGKPGRRTKLQDSAFLEDYIVNNTTAPVLLSINETGNARGPSNFNNNVMQDEPFSWSTKSTKLFLAAYSERKLQFRDPKVKKKRLWQEIVEILKEHGYSNVSEDILDRKIRNMKRSYKTIKENNKTSTTGRGRVSWEYFDTFEEIFANDKTINPDITFESSIKETVVPTTDLSVTENEAFSSNISIINEPSILPEIKNIQGVFPDNNCVSPSTSSSSSQLLATKANKSSLYNQRKKQMDLEQKRIQAINDLKESLNESNRIQKERNELIKQLLLSQAK